MSVYVVWAIIAAVLLAIVFAVWRLSKSRRAVVAPEEKPTEAVPAPRPEEGKPGLKLVPAPEKPALPAEAETPLKAGLAKTRGGFITRLASLLSKKKIDAGLLDQIEEVLFTADIGVKTSQKLLGAVRERLSRDQLTDSEEVWRAIEEESLKLCSLDAPAIDLARSKPFVVLTIGVNGAGKTTTIGKLAAQWIGQGRKVLLAAGDTFRAAATEQLEVWGQRVGAEVVKGKEGGDPSAVIFDAVKRGREQGVDVVIADTAGRLHTKTELMDELAKVRRVIQKAEPTAPHETLLVLDSTNGQNAISQAQIFKQAMEVTGIVLTKLDGTAKGGVILGICDELRVPVRYVGIGEKVSDLRAFDPKSFVEALYDRADA
jgi:fused signal recognition particle receptor